MNKKHKNETQNMNLPKTMHKLARILSKSITRLKKIIHGAKHSHRYM